MGLAEKVMSLTFRRKKILHMFRDVFLVKLGVFEEHSAHSKAVFDDSSITVDIKGLANHTSHIIQELRYPRYFQYSGYFPNNE